MHGWKRNPKAPSSLWDGLVLDGAFAGLHPGTTRFADGSGLGNDGTLTNMDPATDWVWVPELGRWALDFDGSNDYVYLGTSSALNPISISVCCWIRLNSIHPTNYSAFVSRAAGGWELLIHGPKLAMYGNATSGTFSYDGTGKTLAVNTWYHVVMVYSNYIGLIGYLNGVVDGSGVSQGDMIQTVTPAHIGAEVSPLGRYSNAIISDVAIWSRVLAPAEITWLANPANRLYVPDTRRAFYVPDVSAATHRWPWQIRRMRRTAGTR